MNMHEDFIEILKWAIAQAGSMRKLSDITGIDPTTFVRWKSKARVPALDSIQPIFDYLRCSWDEALLKSRGLEQEGRTHDTTQALEEVFHLRAQIESLKLEHAKSLGQVELLKEQLANAQRAAISNCVTQTVNGDKNRAVINAENKEG